MADELRSYVTAHPLRDAALLTHDLDDTEEFMEAAARGQLRRRVVHYPAAAGPEAARPRDDQTESAPPAGAAAALERAAPSPESESPADFSPVSSQDIQRMERRLRRLWLGRSRLARARAILWRLLGLSLALLWVNFAWVPAGVLTLLPVIGEPLGAFVGTVGYSAGGPALATLIGLAPLFWAWRRAAAHAAEARRYGRASRTLASRRFAAVPLEVYASAAGARFAAEAAPVWGELRRQASQLPERGASAAGDLARGSRVVFQMARRHGWHGAAEPLYALFARFDALERRLSLLEAKSGEGVLALRRMRREAIHALRSAAARLAPYEFSAAAPGTQAARRDGPAAGRVPTYGARPAIASLAGVAMVAATLTVTGLYFVGEGTAAIVDPLEARLARLASAIGQAGPWSGLRLFGAPPPQDLPVEVEESPGMHWTLPRPFTARHAVALGPQLLPVQAAFRRVRPDNIEVVQAVIVFRITNLDRWARRDADGQATAHLSQELSTIFETVIQSQRRTLRLQLAQQDPQLAGDEAEVARRVDTLLAQRMEEVVGAFVQSVGRSEVVRASGIQLSGEFRMQIVRRPGSALGIE